MANYGMIYRISGLTVELLCGCRYTVGLEGAVAFHTTFSQVMGDEESNVERHMLSLREQLNSFILRLKPCEIFHLSQNLMIQRNSILS